MCGARDHGSTTENRIGVGFKKGSENGECVPWVLKY